MSTADIRHLELLAETDHLVQRLDHWAKEAPAWEPLQRAQLLVGRLLARAERLRVRLESPLVVAAFGGTGTGKSTLINAIVGSDVVRAGRERPTTLRPSALCHPRTNIEPLKLPEQELDVVRVEAPILHDLVLIDCPDPDTGHEDVDSTNLERLRKIVPYCDVLLYVSTQQKYRSQRVADELLHAAPGCRLVFVQTHADQDTDIRDDWRAQLEDRYDVAEMFFVDSVAGLAEQAAGRNPTGELGRLLRFLSAEMTGSKRGRIRRANLLDLIDATLKTVEERIAALWPQVEQLETALAEQTARLEQELARELADQLRSSRALWERRLLQAVLERWGLSPFSAVLRVYHGFGGLLATAGLYRARSAAQLAILGAIHGGRMLSEQRRQGEDQLRIAGVFGRALDESRRREAELVIRGYAQAAQIEWPERRAAAKSATADDLRASFLGQAEQQIDEIVSRVSTASSGWWIRRWYDLLVSIYVLYIVARIGKNFFYDSFLYDEPILASQFYIPAILFLLLWCGLLLMAFLRRLQRGLSKEIRQLAETLASVHVENGLFPELETTCHEIRDRRNQLHALISKVSDLRTSLDAETPLGGRKMR